MPKSAMPGDAAVREGSIHDRPRVTVAPDEFKLIAYDSGEIAAVVVDLAARLGLANPIRIVVDETTPMARMSSSLAGTTSDSLITIHVESGALEDTKRFTNFNRHHAEVSLGRMLLRARDRLRPDFADAPDDDSLSLQQEAAWNTYVNGRLERLGVETNRQRWKYNHRNRFGFSDAVDAEFERLWAANDLSWSALDPS
jgi:hypothetical protein